MIIKKKRPGMAHLKKPNTIRWKGKIKPIQLSVISDDVETKIKAKKSSFVFTPHPLGKPLGIAKSLIT